MCQEGREATYMALASAPLFLAKLPVGFLSGYLLEKYCPDEGERESQKMWMIIGIISISSPIMMTLLWKYLSKTEEEPNSPDLKEPLDGRMADEPVGEGRKNTRLSEII